MNRHKIAAVLSALLLVCCGALILGQKVNAAGEGKITGTVKLDGAAPHMKGIDMSKDPYCTKAHANDTPHLETYVTGANGGLENVVLYISDWSGSAQTSTVVPVFISGTWLWGHTLRTNQRNPPYNHLVPSQCHSNTRCAGSTQWL